MTKSYPYVAVKDHPRDRCGANKIREHVIVAERALGHFLPAKAVVHHVDSNQSNNTNRNLVICQDQAYHNLLHKRTRIVKAGGDPNNDRVCGRCKAVTPIEKMVKNGGYCKPCFNDWWRGQNYRAKRAEAAS